MMTEFELSGGTDPEAHSLAMQIATKQTAEIATMNELSAALG